MKRWLSTYLGGESLCELLGVITSDMNKCKRLPSLSCWLVTLVAFDQPKDKSWTADGGLE